MLNAENEYEAYSSARDFKHEQSGFELTDFWECKFRSWTYQYLWCRHAITWAIRQYDNAKANANEGPTI